MQFPPRPPPLNSFCALFSVFHYDKLNMNFFRTFFFLFKNHAMFSRIKKLKFQFDNWKIYTR